MGAGPLVLLVTQFTDEQAIYGDSLRASGFGVRIADNADTALELSVAERPDVVVTRVPQAGPRTTEGDLWRRLKQTEATKSIGVVVITSLMQPEFRTQAFDAGCDGYVLIPALPEALIDEVRRVIARRPCEAA